MGLIQYTQIIGHRAIYLNRRRSKKPQHLHLNSPSTMVILTIPEAMSRVTQFIAAMIFVIYSHPFSVIRACSLGQSLFGNGEY